MLRRYVESPGQLLHGTRLWNAGGAAGAVRLCALVTVQMLLIGCGSTAPLPTLEQYPQQAPAPAVQTPAAAPSTSASQSEPAVTAASEASVPPSEQPAAAAPSEPRGKPSRFSGQPKPEQPAQSQPAPIGPLALDNTVIPPQAQQQFAAALALAEAGDFAAAEKAFDTLNAQYPNYAGPLVNLAVLRAKAGKLEAAEQALQAAVERNPDSAPAFNQLGVLYRRLGRFKEADTAYLRAVQIDPEYANAYFNLGVLCDLYLQQPQRALEAFERYLELASPPDAKVNGWVSELKARLGNARSARSEQ